MNDLQLWDTCNLCHACAELAIQYQRNHTLMKRDWVGIFIWIPKPCNSL